MTMTMTDIDEAITESVFDHIEGIVREIEPGVMVRRTPLGITFSNPDTVRLQEADTTPGERETLRPWIVNAFLHGGDVSIYRMFGREITSDVELADPDSFDQIEAALRRWCRHWREDEQ